MNDYSENQLSRAQKCIDFLQDNSASLTNTPAINAELLPEIIAKWYFKFAG